MEKAPDSILIYGEDHDGTRMKKMAADAREDGHKVGLRSLPMIRRGGQRETADLIIVLAPHSPADAALFDGYADRVLFEKARPAPAETTVQPPEPGNPEPVPPLSPAGPQADRAPVAAMTPPNEPPATETTTPLEKPGSEITEALKRKPGRPPKAADPFARMNRAQLVKELGDRSIAFDHKATDENLRELLRLMTGDEKDG